MTKSIVVGVGDCSVTGDRDAVIVTYALGSCIAVALYDPVAEIGGLLHYMLPLSVLDAKQAQERPCMFCDSGMERLLQLMTEAGAQKNRLIVQAAGGAQVLDDRGVFNIGRKNEQILRQIISAYRLSLTAAEFGGSVSRTVGLEVSSGRFWIKEWQITADAGQAREPKRAGALG